RCYQPELGELFDGGCAGGSAISSHCLCVCASGASRERPDECRGASADRLLVEPFRKPGRGVSVLCGGPVGAAARNLAGGGTRRLWPAASDAKGSGPGSQLDRSAYSAALRQRTQRNQSSLDSISTDHIHAHLRVQWRTARRKCEGESHRISIY